MAYMIEWLEKKAGPQLASSSAPRGSILEDNENMKAQIGKMNQTLAEAGAMMKGEEEKEESEEEDDDDDELDEIPESFRKPEGQMKTARASVSAEAYGAWNQKKAFTPPNIPKSDEQKARLSSTLAKSFLFSALDEKDMGIVVGAMSEQVFEAGKRVITQGDDGDFLFVIEEGKLECKIKINEEEKVVK